LNGQKGLGALVAGQFLVLNPETVLAFNMSRVFGDAVYRADLDALRFVIVTDALGAFSGIDFIDFCALRNRLVRTLGLADVAIDALVGDD
jgi:hypothetical protein